MSNKKLRILQAVYCLGRGGAERLAIDITNELNKREDVEALLISFDKTTDYEYSTKDVNYKYCPSKVNLSIFKKNKIEIDNYLEVIKDFKPNIIHSHRFLSEVITRQILFPDIKYFTHLHDNMKQFKELNIKTIHKKSEITNYYEKLIMTKKYKKCNNHFVAISNDTYNYFRKVLPNVLKDNISLVHNAIDFKRFCNNNEKKELNPDKINLISIGSFSNKKNHVFFVDVIENLKNRNLNVHLNILGEGETRKLIEKKINTKKLNKYITLHGNVNNIESYIKESDIYLHSAIYEPFGLVLLEAMAGGLPCVTLNGKGNVDIIKDGYNGYMINKPDIVEFSNKIELLINNKDLYNKISENAVNFAKQFDIKHYVDKLLDLYNKVLNS